MTEKTKREKETSPAEANKKAETEKDQAAWEKDQQERSYYYDDAHGYEIYDPDEDSDCS